MPPAPDIDASRLAADLDALARIGALPGGGVSRLAFTDADRAGRDFVAGLLVEIGLEPRIDAVGNLFAVYPGTEPGEGIVLAGSHTDSVGAAGRFDGALGVLASVAALRAIVDAGQAPARGVGLVSFVNEEGVRYMTDMMGSLFVRGDLSLEQIRALEGIDGTRLGDELDRTGMAGPDSLRDLPVAAFLELHIEQGPVLVDSGTDIGIVEAVQGLRWLRCRLLGRANHAGTTPMDRRQDAGLAASRIVTAVRALTTRIEGLRATVGRLGVEPGGINVIPGRAECTIDLRHPDPDRLAHADRSIREEIAEIAREEGLRFEIEQLADSPPVRFDAGVIAAVEGAVRRRGLAGRRMISGAGHDAQIMSRVWPTAMIFVPSRDGVSHNPAEFTDPADCAAGARVLLDAMLDLAAR